MKREILCLKCEKKLKPKKYPGEWFRRVDGVAMKDYVCDHCDVKIKEGSICCAESMGLDSQPWLPWEQGFIRLVDPDTLAAIKKLHESAGVDDENPEWRIGNRKRG